MQLRSYNKEVKGAQKETELNDLMIAQSGVHVWKQQKKLVDLLARYLETTNEAYRQQRASLIWSNG